MLSISNRVQLTAVGAVNCTGFAVQRNRYGVVAVQSGMLDHFLARHDGVISRMQARECGLSDDAIDRLLHSGRWAARFRGVYFVPDRPFTADARIRCAVLNAGPRAVASAEAAAFWHRLIPRMPNVIDVTVPRKGRSRARGCRLRRRDLHSEDIVELRGLPVTSLNLTVLEASVTNSDVMDLALQRHTNLDGLRRTHALNAGRTGAPRAEVLLTAAESLARSEGERLLVRLLRSRKLKGWVVNFKWGGYEIDVAFPAEMVAIEFDGWAFHSDRHAFQRDRSRQNMLSRDWTILRYTWSDLTERPDYVITQIIATLDRIRCT